MAGEFEIQGLDAVLAKLKGLRSDQMRSGFAKAAGRAMQVVKRDAVAGARRFDDPATAASIAANISVSTSAKKSKPYIVSKVGVKGGAKVGSKLDSLKFSNTKGNIKKGLAGQSYSVAHWRFLEFGTENMAAQPFMRPALANNVPTVTATFVSAASAEIDKIIAKGA